MESKERINNFINKCDECDLKECIECEYTWSDMQDFKKYINNLEKEIEELKREIKNNVIDNMEIQNKLEKSINYEWKEKIQKKINFIQGLYNTQEEPIEIAYQQQWIVDTTALLEELLEEE